VRIPVATEKLGHLGLQRSLEHQAHTQPGDLFQDRAELTLGVGE
jgi:hypothetical protein